MFKSIKNMILPNSNKVIYKLARTRYAKRAINSLFILTISSILRTVLYSLCAFFIVCDNILIDFTTQCIISITLCSYNRYIQYCIEFFYDDLYKVTRHVINNYSNENYHKWRNYITVITIITTYIYFYFIELNSYLIRIYILQYAVCYICLDIHKIMYKLKIKLFPVDNKFTIITMNNTDDISLTQSNKINDFNFTQEAYEDAFNDICEKSHESSHSGFDIIN